VSDDRKAVKKKDLAFLKEAVSIVQLGGRVLDLKMETKSGTVMRYWFNPEKKKKRPDYEPESGGGHEG